MNPSNHFIFATPILVSNPIYNISKNEIEFIKQIKKGRNIHNGYSLNKFIFDTTKKLDFIKRYCEKWVEYYAYKILLINPKTKFYITQSWTNYNQKGNTHHQHDHPNSLISGIFFIQGKASTVFYRRHKIFPLEFQHLAHNEVSANRYYFDLKVGQLCLFPSSLEHSVIENKFKEERITLAFNTFAKGEFGEADDCVCYLKL